MPEPHESKWTLYVHKPGAEYSILTDTEGQARQKQASIKRYASTVIPPIIPVPADLHGYLCLMAPSVTSYRDLVWVLALPGDYLRAETDGTTTGFHARNALGFISHRDAMLSTDHRFQPVTRVEARQRGLRFHLMPTPSHLR